MMALIGGRNMEAGKDIATRGVPVAEAFRLDSLANYQEGSVVSRQIVKQEKGNVTLFAFDEGQGLSEHTAPFDALVHVIDGEAEITISGKLIRAKSGEMVIMPANQPHALKAGSRFKMVLTMIRT
jgi:quercetin dioxygenase-like cupin family protein